MTDTWTAPHFPWPAGRTDPRGSAEPVLRLLSDVSAALAESLDHECTLTKAARLVVPVFADWCLVDVVQPDGRLKRIEVAGRSDADPRAVAALRTWAAGATEQPTHPLGHALHDRSPTLVPEAHGAADDPCGGETPDAAALRAARVRSMIVAPLVARGRTLGVLTFALQHERRPYGANELATAEQLAHRAALSMDNARLYHDAQEKSARAEEANRARDEFLAMLGHELRNPLAPILTALELLKSRDQTASKEHSIIERQVKHLVTLVDDLLDVSRVTSGRIQIRRRRVWLHDIITKAIEMAMPLIEQRRHQLTVSVPEDLVVEGDEQRLAQVFANLLTNAAKYTDPGGHIQVLAMLPSDDGVVISVRDDGRGINPILLPRVFDLFVQSKRTIDRAEGGLGLGLAIVRSLVKLHGGRVHAHSDGAGRGSAFTVWLPALLKAPREENTGLHVNPTASEATRGERVLVVDDNEDLAELMAEYLQAQGYDVRMAHDGAKALEIAERFRPTVALLDLGLPVMDGRELGRRLLQMISPPPALVAMTGYGQASDREASRAAGFARHLTKPVQPTLVTSVIQELIANRLRGP